VPSANCKAKTLLPLRPAEGLAAGKSEKSVSIIRSRYFQLEPPVPDPILHSPRDRPRRKEVNVYSAALREAFQRVC